ncbi:ArnT family glycosyltransferase [Nocardioides sp. Bht2]|uniref:ArnT family glycosyltransferase n=1 Tax=Nocardioides sp. Bht2 TaxID=3392297 RepID=UPI0039B3CDBB
MGTIAWRRGTTAVLLGATALLYLWGLDESGWANAYYSAAAQAGAASWKAFFFGSLDAGNAITVDKTPLALWPMALSVRLFGLSSWSVLVPQAVFGVATVYLMLRIVRRSSGSHQLGLLAGAIMALTPVAALMFRYNNPDALLVLLLVAASAATLRAVEASALDPRSAGRWLALGGALLGLAYLAKMLQAFVIAPALVLTYLLFAALPLSRRLWHLAGAVTATVLAAGWWVATVALWPADSRPWIGGSQDNSVWGLTIGYNGLGRLNGNEEGSIGSGHWGQTSLLRLLSPSNGGQAGWLLPTALVLLVAGLVLVRSRQRRTSLQAALVLFGTWLLVTLIVFSLMRGIYHSYYAVALAPALAVVIALGGRELWLVRAEPGWRALTVLLVATTGGWSFVLLDRSPDFVPWLRWAVLAIAVAAALVLLRHQSRRTARWALALCLTVGLTGPAAFSVATAALPHQGAVITAGPGGRGSDLPHADERLAEAALGAPPLGTDRPARNPSRHERSAELDQLAEELGLDLYRSTYGPAGSLLHVSTPSPRLVHVLQNGHRDQPWLAATVGANAAAGFQLATGRPVIAIGGFNGTDPNPDLATFQLRVLRGEIGWFIGGGVLGPQTGGSQAAREITAWVAARYRPFQVDGVLLYDLSLAPLPVAR